MVFTDFLTASATSEAMRKRGKTAVCLRLYEVFRCCFAIVKAIPGNKIAGWPIGHGQYKLVHQRATVSECTLGWPNQIGETP